MPNLGFLKRLIKEDFAKKDQELVAKVGAVLNPALEQLVIALNKGLSISDLNTQVKDLEIIVDSNGFPINNASFKFELKGKCTMMQVGRAQAIDSNTVYPTGGHSITFTENAGQVTINHITGLPANQRFLVRFIAYV